MSGAPGTVPCFSCGAMVPDVDGPTHDYMLSSPGCWAIYGEVLAREYQTPALMAYHQLTVDAYAVQHPGDSDRASRRSVYLHLISLCAVLERGLAPCRANGLIRKVADASLTPPGLEPPESIGDVTVADVHAAGPDGHLDAVERWARSAWNAWSPHHPEIQRRVTDLV